MDDERGFPPRDVVAADPLRPQAKADRVTVVPDLAAAIDHATQDTHACA